jgi:transcriptional regulator with XRE-family HTH domain
VSNIYPIKNSLRRHRIARGLTQKEVAKILNLGSSSVVSRWERGERVPNLVQALSLSALYKRLVNDLFFDLFDEQRNRVVKRARKLQEKKEQKASRDAKKSI